MLSKEDGAGKSAVAPRPLTELLACPGSLAQRIGASRETVTRLLSELRKKDWIRLEGSTLVIKNRQALQQMAM